MGNEQETANSKDLGPLVSVGIPTFNRPEGLRRTLSQILSQSYGNLEVIVSDNASSDPEVERVCLEFVKKDARIKYVRQPENIGATSNFRFVLNQATGEYFMWAADDDEWSPLFVETCLRASKNGESVACRFDTLYRFTGQREGNTIPELDPAYGKLANVHRFLECMQPSLIYGLHKRSSLEYFERVPVFDFSDCYVVFRQILGPGLRTIPDVLYAAGIDAPVYEIKYADAKTRKLDYAPFYLRTVVLIVRSKSLTFAERFDALKALTRTTLGLIKHHERCEDPKSVLYAQIRRRWARALNPWNQARS